VNPVGARAATRFNMQGLSTLLMLVFTSSDALVITRALPTPVLSRSPAAFTPLMMQRYSSARSRTPPPMATANPQPNAAATKPWWRRALKQLLFTTSVVGAAVLLRVPGTVQPAHAAAKTAKKAPAGVTRQQQAMSTILFAGGLSYWAARSAAAEDEEEEVRIKEENEKLEAETKEFTDIDGDGTVVADADLLASLRKRMGNSTDTDGEGGEGKDPEAPVGGGGGGAATRARPPAGGGGGAATLAPPAEPPAEPTPGGSEEDIERLKRMFGTSEE